MIKNFIRCFYHSLFGFATTALGVYLLQHHDYLDDPRVTWQPIPRGSHIVGFVDDIWFSVILLIVGIGLIIGVAYQIRWLKRAVMYACAGIYALFAFSFGLRGLLEAYFNTSWVVDFIAAIVAFHVASGGHDDA